MSTNGQSPPETQSTPAVVGQNPDGIHTPGADIHALLGHYARLLWDLQRVRIMVGNRISAMERDDMAGEWMALHQETMKGQVAQERAVERQLARLVKQHIMYDWVLDCPGLGVGGFARIVGVTGQIHPVEYDDAGEILRGFPTVSKMWRYLGMSVDNGAAPKRQKGQKLNYSPQGRVVCHQIAESIVKLGHGRYREVYDETKEKYLTRERFGDSECPMGQEHKNKAGKVLACVKVDGEGKETSGHLHNAAMRKAVKELLKDLWVEWRKRAEVHLESMHDVPVARP